MSLTQIRSFPTPRKSQILIYEGETYEKDKKDNLSLGRE